MEPALRYGLVQMKEVDRESLADIRKVQVDGNFLQGAARFRSIIKLP